MENQTTNTFRGWYYRAAGKATGYQLNPASECWVKYQLHCFWSSFLPTCLESSRWLLKGLGPFLPNQSTWLLGSSGPFWAWNKGQKILSFLTFPSPSLVCVLSCAVFKYFLQDKNKFILVKKNWNLCPRKVFKKFTEMCIMKNLCVNFNFFHQNSFLITFPTILSLKDLYTQREETEIFYQ